MFNDGKTDDPREFTNNGSDYYGIIGLEQLSVTDSSGDGLLAYNNPNRCYYRTCVGSEHTLVVEQVPLSGGTFSNRQRNCS